MKLLFQRYPQINDKQTAGEGYVLNDQGKVIFSFYTLELSWKNNERQISCIPIGKYEVVKRFSQKYKDHFHILNVPNRTWILIHHGNFHKDTLGCVLVGKELKDIDGDGMLDVTASLATMRKLNKLLPKKFNVEILKLQPSFI